MEVPDCTLETKMIREDVIVITLNYFRNILYEANEGTLNKISQHLSTEIQAEKLLKNPYVFYPEVFQTAKN